MAEVSGAADFSYVSGTASFYSTGETELRIPRRFSAVRISVPADGSAAGFSVSARGGSCSLRSGVLTAEGSALTSAAGGALYPMPFRPSVPLSSSSG